MTDLLIVGAGPTGLMAGYTAAKRGLIVTLVEMKRDITVVNRACSVTVVLGILSLVFIWNYDKEGLMTFRWLTVDGTVFTTVISLVFVVVSILEIVRYTELTSQSVYYLRLASAVTEGLIIIVVLLSQLPVSVEHLHIFRFDMFNMHILIPVLTIASFLLNDSPIGKLNARQLLQGILFIMLYTVVILVLIIKEIIPAEQIPYFFLDIVHIPFLNFVSYSVFLYGLSFLLSFLLSRGNRKLSWIWFKGIARA